MGVSKKKMKKPLLSNLLLFLRPVYSIMFCINKKMGGNLYSEVMF